MERCLPLKKEVSGLISRVASMEWLLSFKKTTCFTKEAIFWKRRVVKESSSFKGFSLWKGTCYWKTEINMMLSFKGILACCPVLRRELLFEENSLVESKTYYWKKSHIKICLWPCFFFKGRLFKRNSSLNKSLLVKTKFLLTSFLFPQIAGSYRGSYFSKVGLLITEIAAAPSLPASFVSLHLSPCVLITEIAAAPSLPSSFVSLHLSPCMLITEIAAAPSLPSSFALRTQSGPVFQPKRLSY